MTINQEDEARRFAKLMRDRMRHETRHIRIGMWAVTGVGALATAAGLLAGNPPAILVGGAVTAVGLGIQFASMRSFNIDEGIREYMNQQEWKKLAQNVKGAYADQDPMQVVDKTKLVNVLEAFGALYNSRASKNEHDFYLGKLIGTGRVEGTAAEVMGTVPVQLEKTIEFIRNKPAIYASQASILSESLINCLDKEIFGTSLDIVLTPYKNVLQDIAQGNI
jgi:hypothetical protein